MSSAAPTTGTSEALARFIAGTHTGPEFESALHAARARLIEVRTVLETPNDISELASRALAAYGTPFRRAFVTATTLAATPGAVGSTIGTASSTASTLTAMPSGHHDAAIVAAAIVSSELAGRDEANVVEAIAIGREVAARLERALTLDPPWDAVAVVAGIGAAAAAACAAALDAEAARNAIGLVATQAAGLGVTEGTPAAALGSGKAAADAVEAALLARHGFTSASASLEGRRGLAALMASNFDEAVLSEGLGRRWLSAGV
jgi:hypothetical protein